MTDRERRILVYVAENGNEEPSERAMAQLQAINPTYHWCYDFDLMVICDEDPAWEYCTCHENKSREGYE